jgi:hypothetical protein
MGKLKELFANAKAEPAITGAVDAGNVFGRMAINQGEIDESMNFGTAGIIPENECMKKVFLPRGCLNPKLI